MELLVPSVDTMADWNTLHEALVAEPVLRPFDPVVVDFIDGVSRRLLLNAATRSMPELMVVAHWMRKAHLLELAGAFAGSGDVRAARGRVVHFAPANVDSIFLYSWFLALLAGNSNIVRLSTRRSAQMAYLLGCINEAMEQPVFAAVRSRNLVLSYEHDEGMNTKLSAGCSVRVLWGGDRSIAALRALPLPPLATELVFADRFSLAAVSAPVVLGLTAEKLRELVHRFFNDSFWFDQLACSSPRLIVWVGGSADIVAAKERFWSALNNHVAERQVAYPPVVGITRFTSVCACAAVGDVDFLTGGVAEFPARAHLTSEASAFRQFHAGGGLFLEAEFPSLPMITKILTSKDQTLCYFGFDRADLLKLAGVLPGRAIDRMVPIGQALQFSHTWEGINLLDAFSRGIDIH